MAQSTILAAGTSVATSSDVSVAAGAVVSLGIFVSSGEISREARCEVLMDTPGADLVLSTLTREHPATTVSGPGTFRVARRAAGREGIAVGVFSET